MDEMTTRRRHPAIQAELAELAALEERAPKVRVPSGLLAAAEAVRMVARKLAEESAANVEAARGMLEMLQAEQETFAREVTTAADNFAARVTDYMARGTACMQAIVEHREQIMAVAKTAAEQPPMITDPGER